MSVTRVAALPQNAEPSAAVVQAAVATARVAFIGELRAEQNELAAQEPRAALAETEPGERERDRIAVRLNPLCESAGTILVAAQVVGAQLQDLAPSPASREWDPSKPAAPAPEQVMVEVRSPDDGSARATVHFSCGPLGPLHVELVLAGNQLELTAHVSNMRALEAFHSGEQALRLGLELSGIRLGSVAVTLKKRPPRTNANKAPKRGALRNQEES